ncbi:NERD domain-containing protein [Mesorhizobium sp. M1088]|uniref:nuclease-related domain-containing protein n=1 Tax=Mesorhizobium sp. M1088 TaxID=2957056 RepID=UPI00333CF2EC
MKSKTKSLDRSAVIKAINAMSSVDLKAQLDGVRLTKHELNDLFGLMARCSQLFFRAENPLREAGRDSFLDSVAESITERVGRRGHARAAAFRELIRLIEAGYRDVAYGLRTAAISALPPERQLIAVMERAAFDLDDLRDSVARGLEKQPVLEDQIIAIDREGRQFDADGALAAYVGHVGAALRLLAGRMDSSPSATPLKIPPPGDATEEEIFKAGTSLLCAGAFRRWKRVEERRRFRGGELREIRPPHLPPSVAPTIEVIREFRPNSQVELLDWVANERFRDFLHRQVTSAWFEETNRGFAGIDNAAALAPEGFVSLQERAAFKALLGLLSPDPFRDGQRFQGLTIAEWLRGYATLNSLATDARERNSTPRSRSLLMFAEGELETRLCGAGLPKAAVPTFVASVTLRMNSDDLFDCPVVQITDGRRLLFTPAAADADLTRIILSNLGSLGESFAAKGGSFERHVIEFFRSLGFHTFTVNERKASYQIDALVAWEDHLFLFECKNEWLSEASPVAAFNFERSKQKHVEQILRQVDGIRRHPEMVIAAGGVDPASKTVVPVLLYAFPYSEPDPGHGVYVSDWSSLTRFFESPSFHSVSSSPVRGSKLRRTATHRLWENERPTPADLLRQLRDPQQVRMMIERATFRHDEIWLADHRYALSYDLYREPTKAMLVAVAAEG